jgi:hypothetical protein
MTKGWIEGVKASAAIGFAVGCVVVTVILLLAPRPSSAPPARQTSWTGMRLKPDERGRIDLGTPCTGTVVARITEDGKIIFVDDEGRDAVSLVVERERFGFRFVNSGRGWYFKDPAKSEGNGLSHAYGMTVAPQHRHRHHQERKGLATMRNDPRPARPCGVLSSRHPALAPYANDGESAAAVALGLVLALLMFGYIVVGQAHAAERALDARLGFLRQCEDERDFEEDWQATGIRVNLKGEAATVTATGAIQIRDLLTRIALLEIELTKTREAVYRAREQVRHLQRLQTKGD